MLLVNFAWDLKIGNHMNFRSPIVRKCERKIDFFFTERGVNKCLTRKSGNDQIVVENKMSVKFIQCVCECVCVCRICVCFDTVKIQESAKVLKKQIMKKSGNRNVEQH